MRLAPALIPPSNAAAFNVTRAYTAGRSAVDALFNGYADGRQAAVILYQPQNYDFSYYGLRHAATLRADCQRRVHRSLHRAAVRRANHARLPADTKRQPHCPAWFGSDLPHTGHTTIACCPIAERNHYCQDRRRFLVRSSMPHRIPRCATVPSTTAAHTDFAGSNSQPAPRVAPAPTQPHTVTLPTILPPPLDAA